MMHEYMGMVNITKRQRKGKTEYYLQYSSTGKSKEKYLGTSKPKNLGKIKKEFEERAYREDKYPLLELVKKNYLKRSKSIDPKIIEAEYHGFKISHTYSTQKN